MVEYPHTQFVNGCIVPSKQDYFLVSAVSDDDQNSVQLFRRKHFKKMVGKFETAVLDMKFSAMGNYIFLPKSTEGLQRIKIDLV